MLLQRMAGAGSLTPIAKIAATLCILTNCLARFWNWKGAPAIRESNRRVTFPELPETVCNHTLWLMMR